MTNQDKPADDDPWAARDRGFYPHVEPATASFFIPGIDDPAEAEALWAKLTEGHRPDSRRVYSLTYMHGGSKIEVKVGEQRKEYRRRTGPRGGYIRNADLEPHPRRTGSKVLAIVDAGSVIEVWSEPPPRGWANPSSVGPDSLQVIQYFKPPEPEPGTA